MSVRCEGEEEVRLKDTYTHPLFSRSLLSSSGSRLRDCCCSSTIERVSGLANAIFLRIRPLALLV